jgi:hypothetical protein
MAQILISSDGLDILGRAGVAMDEADKVTNRSCYRANSFHKRLEFMTTGSEAGTS